MFYTRALAGTNPTPDVLDQGDKAAKAILENINTPPPNVTEAQWKTARTDVENPGAHHARMDRAAAQELGRG